jgi:hypothetical protein
MALAGAGQCARQGERRGRESSREDPDGDVARGGSSAAAAITGLQARRPVRRPRTIRDWAPPTLPEEPGGDRANREPPGEAPGTA